MIESPATSVQLFESIHEHPELIWNDKTRTKVCDVVADMCDGYAIGNSEEFSLNIALYIELLQFLSNPKTKSENLMEGSGYIEGYNTKRSNGFWCLFAAVH